MARPGYSTIYLVAVKVIEPGIHLVQASSRAAALAHVAKAMMKVEKPSPSEIHELASKGIKLERAGGDTAS